MEPTAAGDVVFGAGFAATITLSAGELADTIRFSANGYTLTGGDVTMSATNPDITVDTGFSATIASVIQGAGIDKQSAGTLVISGANTHTGLTNIFSGSLTIANDLALGTTGSGTSVANFTSLQMQGNITVTGEALTLDGAGIANDGSLRNLSGNNAYNGNITLTRTARVNADAGSLTINPAAGDAFSGAFGLSFGGSGNVTVAKPIATGLGAVTKDGAGTLTLSGANIYTGFTTVNGGTLRLGVNNAVPIGSSVVVAAGGTLDNGGFTFSGTGLTSLTVQNGGTLRLGGSTSFPTGYGANILDVSSTVEYYGSSAQTVAVQDYGNLTANNASGVTLAGDTTINGNLYVQAGSFSRAGGPFGRAVTIKGNITADAGTTLGGEISAFTFAGTAQNITLSGVTSSQSLGQMIVGTTTSNPTVTLQTNVDSVWGLTVGTSTASTGTLNLNGKTLSVGIGSVTVNSGGTFINTTGTLNINGGFGPRTWTDNTGVQNFGAVALAPVGGIVNLGSNILGTSVSVNGGTFNLGTFTLTAPTLVQASGTTSGGTVLASTALTLQSGTISSVLSGTASATKSTTGTVVLSGANTYTGATTINASGGTLTIDNNNTTTPRLANTSVITVNSGGTLLLAQSGGTPSTDRINNSATMTLNGGTFSKGNFSEGATNSAGVGALTLTSAGSHLDFGSGTVGVLTFASFTPGAFSLTVANWTGTPGTVGNGSTDRLIFNSDQSANLGSFTFDGYAGATAFDLGNGYYEITPVTAVPEPSTYIAGALGLAVLFLHRRKRLRGLFLMLRGPIASRLMEACDDWFRDRLPTPPGDYVGCPREIT